MDIIHVVVVTKSRCLPAMKASLQETRDAVQTVESVQRELKRCRGELYESRKRMEQMGRSEALLAGENRLLEMVAAGDPLPAVLDALCRLVEELSSGCLCSILLLDSKGDRLWHGAAPSLPASYTKAIDGSAIDSQKGPCAQAACLSVVAVSGSADWGMMEASHEHELEQTRRQGGRGHRSVQRHRRGPRKTTSSLCVKGASTNNKRGEHTSRIP